MSSLHYAVAYIGGWGYNSYPRHINKKLHVAGLGLRYFAVIAWIYSTEGREGIPYTQ